MIVRKAALEVVLKIVICQKYNNCFYNKRSDAAQTDKKFVSVAIASHLLHSIILRFFGSAQKTQRLLLESLKLPFDCCNYSFYFINKQFCVKVFVRNCLLLDIIAEKLKNMKYEIWKVSLNPSS